jgi:hypothetical protein
MIRALTCAALLACGCHPIPDHYPGPPELTLGTGTQNFTPLSDGDAVPINMGSQGGHHVWGALQALYLDPRSPAIHFKLTLASDGTLLAEFNEQDDLDGTDDGLTWGQYLGAVVFFVVDYRDAQGKMCNLHLDVTDMEGRTASAEKMIVPM